MKKRRGSSSQIGTLAALFLLTFSVGARSQQDASKPPEAQAVSQTGLLPVYGVNFNFDAAWVDGASFPSRTPVNDSFQQVWDALKPSGFNVVRFRVDVRDAQAANRVANLCVWAKSNSVKLVPVLIGAERGQRLGVDFPLNVSMFVKKLLAALRSGDGSSREAYAQILAYQIEDAVNHVGWHGGMPSQIAHLRLLQAASALRKAEQEGIKDTGLNATPLMVNASFDYELIKAKAIAGATLSDDAYAQAYESLKGFLVELAASPDVDVMGVDWFPGSMSAGSVEKFPALLKSLMTDAAGKQIALATGFSTGFHSAEEQKQFYALAFANLADFRANAGVDSPFIGVIFHEATNGVDASVEPPTPNLPDEIKQWDWAAKADELTQMWSGQAPSDALTWWLKKVENNMGLIGLKLDGAGGNPMVSVQPAQEGLQQIATAVSEANTAAADNPMPASDPGAPPPDGAAAPPPDGSAPGNPLQEKLQQGLMSLLDKVFERLGNIISGGGGEGGGGSGNEGGGGGNDGGGGTLPPPVTLSIGLSQNDVSFEPAAPKVGAPVTFNVTLRNQSADADASGLVVALADEESGSLLGADTQAVDVVIPRGGSQNVSMRWTPTEAKTHRILVKVTDASLNEVAKTSLSPVQVAAAPDDGAGGNAGNASGGAGGIGVSPIVQLPIGLPKIRDLLVGSKAQPPRVGQASSVTVTLENPYTRPVSNLKATLLVDGKVAATKPLGTMLPKQNRFLMFPNVAFPQTGRHEVRIQLESGGAKPLKGVMSSEVQVIPKGQIIHPPPGRVIPPPGGVKSPIVGAKPAPPVRSLLPPSFQVGRVTVPAADKVVTAPPVRPTSPSGSATTTPTRPTVGRAGLPLSPTSPRSSPTTTPTRPTSPGGSAIQQPTRPTTPPGGATTTPTRPTSPIGGTATIPARPALPAIGASPDLSVTSNDVRYDITPSKTGESLNVHVKVRNEGKADAKGAKVLLTLYADNKKAAEKEIAVPDIIKPGGDYTALGVMTMPVGQSLRLDVSATVPQDAKSQNNRASVPINAPRRPPLGAPSINPNLRDVNRFITTDKPDLNVSSRDVRFSPTSPKANDTLTISVTVRNNGKADAKGARAILTLYADGQRLASGSFEADIRVNGTYTTPMWRVKVPSAKQLSVDVSVTVAQDANTRDNQASVNISVAR